MKTLKDIKEKFSVGTNVLIQFYDIDNSLLFEKLGYIYRTTNKKFYCISNEMKNSEFEYLYPMKTYIIDLKENSLTDLMYKNLIVKISTYNPK